MKHSWLQNIRDLLKLPSVIADVDLVGRIIQLPTISDATVVTIVTIDYAGYYSRYYSNDTTTESFKEQIKSVW